jgi:hypothetical protein
MTPINPVTEFKVKPIQFGKYDIHVGIECGCQKGITIDLSEYFGLHEWYNMSAVDQHNWLDNLVQDYAESIITMGWSLVKNV